mgnify:FL=1
MGRNEAEVRRGLAEVRGDVEKMTDAPGPEGLRARLVLAAYPAFMIALAAEADRGVRPRELHAAGVQVLATLVEGLADNVRPNEAAEKPWRFHTLREIAQDLERTASPAMILPGAIRA